MRSTIRMAFAALTVILPLSACSSSGSEIASVLSYARDAQKDDR